MKKKKSETWKFFFSSSKTRDARFPTVFDETKKKKSVSIRTDKRKKETISFTLQKRKKNWWNKFFSFNFFLFCFVLFCFVFYQNRVTKGSLGIVIARETRFFSPQKIDRRLHPVDERLISMFSFDRLSNISANQYPKTQTSRRPMVHRPGSNTRSTISARLDTRLPTIFNYGSRNKPTRAEWGTRVRWKAGK